MRRLMTEGVERASRTPALRQHILACPGCRGNSEATLRRFWDGTTMMTATLPYLRWCPRCRWIFDPRDHRVLALVPDAKTERALQDLLGDYL